MARNPVVLVALDDDAPEPVVLAEARYWDAIVRGEEPPGADIAPSMVATIASVYQLDDAPLPRPAFAAQLEETLLGAHPSVARPREPNTVAEPGSPSPPGAPAAYPMESRRSIVGALATAALLLLTLGLGYAALQFRSFPEQESAPRTTAAETLFSTTLPTDAIPDRGVLNFTFWRLSLDPGTSTPATPEGACCRGPQITHVLAGELTVHVDGPMQVFRGMGNALAGAEAPAAEVVLLPGDTVIHDFSVPAEYANHGAIPVELVNGGLYSGTMLNPWPFAMHLLDGSKENHRAPLGLGPVTVSLVRATLPPDGEFPAPPPGSLLLETGQSGDASVGKDTTDNSLFNINSRAETIYVFTVEPGGTLNLQP